MKSILCLVWLGFLLPVGIAAAKEGTGKISGKVIDPVSKEAIGFASVGLFTAKDSSLVKGSTTDEAGKFMLDKLSNGEYYLKITMVGFSPKNLSNLKISGSQPTVELGTVLLTSNTKKLNTVEIVAQKDLVEYGLDKQTINVAKDLSSVGGTASDALKNAPSVAVDIDGNVSVRGSSNVTVLVNGKNTGQSAQSILSQTPASAIEKIEVITNPSAKYDAEGMGGIINIILKKQTKPGLNGNAALNLGTYDNHNVSLSLNYRIKKFNFFAGYDGMQHYRRGNYQFDRTTVVEDNITKVKTAYLLDQRQTGRRMGRTHIPKVGFDYQLNDKQSITASIKVFRNKSNDSETVTNLFYQQGSNTNSYTARLGNNSNTFQLTDYSLSYRKTFDKKDREFSASAVLTNMSGNFDRRFMQYDLNELSQKIGNEMQENFLQAFEVTPFFVQADYVHPVGEKGKFEAGAKRTQRALSSDFRAELFDYNQNVFVTLPLLSNRIGFKEAINAGYINYSNVYNKLSYQAGLRLETTQQEIHDKGLDKKSPKSYENLFPSFFLSYEINDSRKAQLNYSRRLNRPHYEALNPFPNYSDPFNIWYGNPLLLPEFINAYEASYLQFWKSGSLNTTGFYRKVANVIQQLREPVDEKTATNTYVNLSHGTSYGIEVSGSQNLAKWFRLNGNVSAFNYKIAGGPLALEANSSRFSWLSRINANLTGPKGLSGQISVNYRSPQALAQGTRAAIYNTDISLRKEVLNKKGALTLRVSDVFNTLAWNTNIVSSTFISDLDMKRQTRIATIGFSYRFGEQEKRRRQDPGNSMEGMF